MSSEWHHLSQRQSVILSDFNVSVVIPDGYHFNFVLFYSDRVFQNVYNTLTQSVCVTSMGLSVTTTFSQYIN